MNAQLKPAAAPDAIGSESEADYFRRVLGEASKSGLDVFARSPAHYFAWCAGEDAPPTPAMEFGKAFHAYVLESRSFADRYAVAPDFGDGRTNAAKAAKAEFLTEHAGKALVRAEDMERIIRMADALAAHPLAKNLIIGGESEVTLRWTDPATGLRCKSRSDFYVPELSIAMDLKSTDDANPAAFARSCAKYRYHVQDAFYSDGYAAIGRPIERFLFVAVEKDAPHAVSVCLVDDAARDRANDLVRREMERLAECVAANTWPAYGDGINTLALPAWAFHDE